MEMEYIKTMQTTAYVDKDGFPTCANDFTTGKVCEFYRTKKMGCLEVCLFDLETPLERRKGGCGTLIPGDACRLRKTK